jgi:hypothetical protein
MGWTFEREDELNRTFEKGCICAKMSVLSGLGSGKEKREEEGVC